MKNMPLYQQAQPAIIKNKIVISMLALLYSFSETHTNKRKKDRHTYQHTSIPLKSSLNEGNTCEPHGGMNLPQFLPEVEAK